MTREVKRLRRGVPDKGEAGAWRGGDVGASPRSAGPTFFLWFSGVFAAAALALGLAGWLAVVGLVNPDGAVKTAVLLSFAAVLASLYVVLAVLARRGSDLIRRQATELNDSAGNVRSGYDSVVGVLCGALDLRDNVTQDQAQRVSQLAAVVAWQMGLRKEQVREIERAAILHDVGKMGLADAVLSKPGELSETEWAEMKRHPELGHEVLERVEFLREAAEIVRSHHERFDGAGYPRGLRGEEIPLGARIFAVVDAYGAMTSARPYREPVPHGKAVEEIARSSGSQFDPQVVKSFLEAEKRGLLSGNGRDESPQGLVGVQAKSEGK
jgi:HD-GYP domain-containing protein (c-di-GMP phosphodiesterase class II)